MPSPHSKFSHTTSRRDREVRTAISTELVRAAAADRDIEEVLLGVDPEVQMGELIAMPPSIPASVREIITSSVAARFEFDDDLAVCLHSPSMVLGGETPFERVALGDGEGVLLALGIAPPTTDMLASRRDLNKHVEMTNAARGSARKPVAGIRSRNR